MLTVKEETMVVFPLREAFQALRARARDLEAAFCLEVLKSCITDVMEKDDWALQCNTDANYILNVIESKGLTSDEAFEILRTAHEAIENCIRVVMPMFDFDAPMGSFEYGLRTPVDLLIIFYPDRRVREYNHVQRLQDQDYH